MDGQQHILTKCRCVSQSMAASSVQDLVRMLAYHRQLEGLLVTPLMNVHSVVDPGRSTLMRMGIPSEHTALRVYFIRRQCDSDADCCFSEATAYTMRRSFACSARHLPLPRDASANWSTGIWSDIVLTEYIHIPIGCCHFDTNRCMPDAKPTRAVLRCNKESVSHRIVGRPVAESALQYACCKALRWHATCAAERAGQRAALDARHRPGRGVDKVQQRARQ